LCRKIICVNLAVLTCLPLTKTFCILLSKLRARLFTIFTAYIMCVFLACFYSACDRFPAWSCPLKRAVYSTPDSQCLECCYLPFIHSRHNAKDRSLGVGRNYISDPLVAIELQQFFLARHSICLARYMLSPVRLSDRRVYHRKTAEVRIINFHHRVAYVSFIQKF